MKLPAAIVKLFRRKPAPAPRPRTWEVSYGRRRRASIKNDARWRVSSERPW